MPPRGLIILRSRGLRRLLSSDAADKRGTALGAYGTKGTKGSGASLMGSKQRGSGGFSQQELDALAAGELEADDTLDAGDVLMEVLAEDHRFARVVEYTNEYTATGGGADEDEDGDREALPEPRLLAHRQYLEHNGVGPGTIFQRQQAAQRQKLERASAQAFSYRLPTEAKQQREHERKSRARMRSHDVIENRIQEAMATGAFDDLPGAGKPLPIQENPFEAMSGDAMAHRVLKNAGAAPGWVEQGREIRRQLLAARASLALGWASCVPVWPLPPPSPPTDAAACGAGTPTHADPMAAAPTGGLKGGRETVDDGASQQPNSARGGWRVYPQPAPLLADAEVAAAAPAISEANGSDQEASDAVSVEAAAFEVRIAAERGPRSSQWAATVDAFHDELRAINKLIDSYNLGVPASWMAVHRLNLQRELVRALHEAPQRSKELQTARTGRLARGAERTERATGSAAFVGGSAPTFALHDGPTFPSIWDAVATVIFSKR